MFGRYRLVERIGEGGMGVVWRAFAPDGMPVAVKVLRTHLAADPVVRQRFEREVSTLSRIRSPYVAEVIEADLNNDLPFLATRYVDGPSVQDVVDERGRLDPPTLKAVALGLLDALECIHAAGVVHRDLKPANVLLENGQPRVIDFGIAQLTHDVRLTMTGMVFGTPGYLSPELLNGADPSPAVDIHAWGATVAFAATGRPPFGRGALEAVALSVLQKPPDLAGVERWLEPALVAAMAKDPLDRPTAAELADWFESGRFTMAHPTIDPAAAGMSTGGLPAGPAHLRSQREQGSLVDGMPAQPAPAAAAALAGNPPAPAGTMPVDRGWKADWDAADRAEHDRLAALRQPAHVNPGLAGIPVQAPREAAAWAADVAPAQAVGARPVVPAVSADSPAAAGASGHRRGLRQVAWVVVAWWFAWVAVTTVVPLIGFLGMVAWAAVAHIAISAGRQLRARPERGRAARTTLLALASPWHAARGLVFGVLGVAVGVVISACLVVCVAVLARLLGLTGIPFDAVMAAVAILTGLCAWHGLFGDSLRAGTVRVLSLSTSWHYGRLAYGLLGLIVGLGAVYLAAVAPVSFTPLNVDGVDWLGRWTGWFGG